MKKRDDRMRTRNHHSLIYPEAQKERKKRKTSIVNCSMHNVVDTRLKDSSFPIVAEDSSR